LLAFVYAEYGWRRDSRILAGTNESFAQVKRERTFPSDGDDLAASPLRVISAADTVAIDRLVKGRKGTVLLFSRPDCAPCKWFAAQMDSIQPGWRDSVVVVTPYSAKHEYGPLLMLDSASTKVLPGVPATLIVDVDGYVQHSALGLRKVLRMFNINHVPSPNAERIAAYRDSLKATVTQ